MKNQYEEARRQGRAEERERCARIVEKHLLPAKLAEAWALEIFLITDAIRNTRDAIERIDAFQGAEIERLRAALEKIASCDSHHPDDVVAIARLALTEAKPKGEVQ